MTDETIESRARALSPEAEALREKLGDSPMIKPAHLVAAAELVEAGLATCYAGQDGELYLNQR